MRIHRRQLHKLLAVGCFLDLLLLWPLPFTTSAQNQSGKVTVTMKAPFFGGLYGSCILIEEREDGPGQHSNAVSDTPKYQLRHKIVAERDKATEANLPPGMYRIRVLSRGLDEFTSEPFKLSSGETKAFDITLQRSMAMFGVTEPSLEDPLITAQAKGIKRLIPFKTVVLTDNSGIRKAENVVITNAQDWEVFWNKIHATVAPRPELADIDFKNKIVIASSLGERNTGGFGIEIIRAVETDDAIELWVKTHGRGGGAVTMAFTQPIHVIEMESVDKKITFGPPRYQSPCQ